MPGGAEEAWPRIKPILQKISAKAGENQEPCCDWISTVSFSFPLLSHPFFCLFNYLKN